MDNNCIELVDISGRRDDCTDHSCQSVESTLAQLGPAEHDAGGCEDAGGNRCMSGSTYIPIMSTIYEDDYLDERSRERAEVEEMLDRCRIFSPIYDATGASRPNNDPVLMAMLNGSLDAGTDGEGGTRVDIVKILTIFAAVCIVFSAIIFLCVFDDVHCLIPASCLLVTGIVCSIIVTMLKRRANRQL